VAEAKLEVIRFYEELINKIDLKAELFAWGMELRDEFLYGDAFIPVVRARVVYTPMSHQLTAGQPRTGSQPPPRR
jgi:hypothetical protein